MMAMVAKIHEIMFSVQIISTITNEDLINFVALPFSSSIPDESEKVYTFNEP